MLYRHHHISDNDLHELAIVLCVCDCVVSLISDMHEHVIRRLCVCVRVLLSNASDNGMRCVLLSWCSC